jgi:hypothetical protein
MSKPLTAEEILALNDRRVEKVACPEWGGHVHVRSLSGEELDGWEVEQYERSRVEKDEGRRYLEVCPPSASYERSQVADRRIRWWSLPGEGRGDGSMLR